MKRAGSMVSRSGVIAVAVILLSLAGVHAWDSVRLSVQRLCTVTGSTVTIPCECWTQECSNAIESQWLLDQSSELKTRVLSKDPQNSQLQNLNTWWKNCELKLFNVRLNDSGDYKFRFRTKSSDWISSSSAVTLTVTDLKVTVTDDNYRSSKNLDCSSSCILSNNPKYIWYRNGERRRYESYKTISSGYTDSYSCTVEGLELLRSPAVCVYNNNCWSVTYSATTICALIGSSVEIHSYYTFPNHLMVRKILWFIQRQRGVEPVDLREDEEYRDRVQYEQKSQNHHSMRINNLKQNDAQTYKFRFNTNDPNGRYSDEPGVTLTVTDLKVEVKSWNSGSKTLDCSSSCTLSNNPKYIWYKNGQRVINQDRKRLSLSHSSGYTDSYSCTVEGLELLRSPAVCVYNNKCWSVTYSPTTICALIGSSVEIHSYYTFPNHLMVRKTLWFIQRQRGVELVDLREDEEYRDRVQYEQKSQNHHSMRINNLKQNDAQTYKFRFNTNDPDGKYSGEPGVTLTVTDLEVEVERESSRSKTLYCRSSCALPNNPKYIWYRNNTVYDCERAHCSVPAVSGLVQYSCAFEAYSSFVSSPVYSPHNTRAEVLPPGETAAGASVTLSCGSDANPPVHTYSWFKETEAAEKPLIPVQNYTITNISSQHSGVYFCSAQNDLGQQNSTRTRLDVLYSPNNTRAEVLPPGETVEGDFVTLSCGSDANPPVHTYSWFKETEAAEKPLIADQNYTITDISSQHSGVYFCSAQNDLGQQNSTRTRLDVLYAPRTTSVVSFLSLHGDSVTLQCHSDSNPISDYIWYRKTGSDITLIGNGTNITLAVGSVDRYFCVARNRFGKHHSPERSFTRDNSAVKYAASGLALLLLPACLASIVWASRRRAAAAETPADGRRREETSSKSDSACIYANVSDGARSSDPARSSSRDDQDDVNYSAVYFKRYQTEEDSLYSTVQPPKSLDPDEDVEYSALGLVRLGAATKDETFIYSTIQKP